MDINEQSKKIIIKIWNLIKSYLSVQEKHQNMSLFFFRYHVRWKMSLIPPTEYPRTTAAMNLQELTGSTPPWMSQFSVWSTSLTFPRPPVVRTTARFGEEGITNRYNAQNKKRKCSGKTASYLQMKLYACCHHQTHHTAGAACDRSIRGSKTPVSRQHLAFLLPWASRSHPVARRSFRPLSIFLHKAQSSPDGPWPSSHPAKKTSLSPSSFLGNSLKRQKRKGGAFHPPRTPYFLFGSQFIGWLSSIHLFLLNVCFLGCCKIKWQEA